MSTKRTDQDKYEAYERQFDPLVTDRKARRNRKPRLKQTVRAEAAEPAREMDELPETEGSFVTTYQPSKHESMWLLSSLRGFFYETLITDIEALVKGGKEASVYRCTAHERLDTDFLAAKVYRPRMFRSLSNDAMYREGRQILTAEGRAVKTTDHRTMRAIGKKSGFGQQVAHTSWLTHEYTTLSLLYQAGAAVPQPVAMTENAILMTYLGDEYMAAPALAEIRLEPKIAKTLFQEVLRNIELMLQHDMIHGDLSAYNILYWEDKITLIDFPQVTNSQANHNAEFILRRDIERICEYFARQGVTCDANRVMTSLSGRYMDRDRFSEDDEVID